MRTLSLTQEALLFAAFGIFVLLLGVLRATFQDIIHAQLTRVNEEQIISVVNYPEAFFRKLDWCIHLE
jgi:hypothetical protein